MAWEKGRAAFPVYLLSVSAVESSHPPERGWLLKGGGHSGVVLFPDDKTQGLSGEGGNEGVSREGVRGTGGNSRCKNHCSPF